MVGNSKMKLTEVIVSELCSRLETDLSDGLLVIIFVTMGGLLPRDTVGTGIGTHSCGAVVTKSGQSFEGLSQHGSNMFENLSP